jgi:LysM repeat protein
MNFSDRRIDLVSRLGLAIALVLTLAMVLLFTRSSVFAEPTEEDLPPVSAVHSGAADTNSSPPADASHSASTASPRSANSSDAADSDSGSNDNSRTAPGDTSEAGANDASPGTGASAQPHHIANYFPYTIRTGDSLHSIGNLFGLDSSVIAHANHVDEDNPDLIAGHTLRIPNPYLARMRDLEGQIDRLSAERSEINQKATTAESQLSVVQNQLRHLTASDSELRHEVVALPWWRAAAYTSVVAAILMFGVTAMALFEWFTLRGRFRAVAEMNEALRRLDYRYRGAIAKAELRLQELYGRRRRGFENGQERPRIAEDTELDRLHEQLKEILEAHLARLGPPGERARRARWRELISGIGAPAEARSARR